MEIRTSLLGMLLTAVLLLTGLQTASAEVDYNSRTVRVTGMGAFPPRAVNAAQARMMARRAAVADGYRQLAESIKGVQVDAETTVQDFITQSDTINTKISAVIQGARILSEQIIPDGGYEVVMEVPLFGISNSVAEAVIERPTTVIPFPEPVQTPSVKVQVSGGYTGVIIDCRGMNINFVMSPVVKDSSGVKLYGHQNLDYDMVIRDGMVSYASDMSQASRAGSNPLVIKAERLDDHNANPVISVNDGSRLLMENQSAGFLSKTAVVFLY